jgi:hypothetical protein
MLRVLLRAAPWHALLGLTAAGAATGVLALALPVGSGARVLQMALVLGGGAAACALEEPAAAVVGACPVRRSTQVLARAAAAAAPLAAGGALVLLWSVAQSLDRLLLLQLVGSWSLGFVLALLARSRLDEPAEVAASAVVLSLLAAMYLSAVGRYLVLFPLGEQVDRATRTWWAVLGAAAGGLALALPERRWRSR